MRVTNCTHALSALVAARFPRDGRTQVAFMGRSNVGKSSLLNRLVGRQGLARTSKSPGRTRMIHFFAVNQDAYFVDLPGYGYARVPRSMREEWRGLVESYLEGPSAPDLAVVLVDARHPPTPLDQELVEWLRSRGLRMQVVLTKIDKLPRGDRGPAVGRAIGALDLTTVAPPLGVSAVTGDGLPALWRVLDDALAAGRQRRSRHAPSRGDAARSVHHHPAHTNPPHHPTRGRSRP
jgi:GTP-binding protein